MCGELLVKLVYFCVAEMGQVEVPVLPMYSVQPFQKGSVFEDFSVSKMVVGSIVTSLRSRVV